MKVLVYVAQGRYLQSFLSFFYLSALLLLVGCSESSETTVTSQVGELSIAEIELGQANFNQITGAVSTNYTLTNDKNWLIDGGLFVLDGATLTIQEGTIIYAAFNENTSFLSVQRGGRIEAVGSSSSPILFTSIRKLTSIPQPGDWGGLIINGRAPINLSGGEGEGEGGTGTYGGSIPNDDSGVLRYVIVEYGGKQLGEENELNGISFNGVGNGTTVEFVESLYGLDDGFEMFGGTVNLRYAVSLGNGDDSFDWTYGWTGYGQFWVAQQDPFDGDRGIEADNNASDPLAMIISNPTIANLTLVGTNDGDPDNSGIVLRNGTKGAIYNAIVTSFSNHGVSVGETSTPYIATEELVLRHSRVFGNAEINGSGQDFNNSESFDMDSTNQRTEEIDLEGFVGVEATEFDPATLDSWFISAPYIGAVPAENNWTNGWIEILR